MDRPRLFRASHIRCYTRRWSFQSKSRGRENKRTPPTLRYPCIIHHVTRPRYFPSLLQPLTPCHQTTLRTLHQWHRVLLQVHRQETRCCTARDQRRDAHCSPTHRAVTTQFLAELRVYTTVSRYRNITAFLGCLENVDMVLEYIDGRTLYEVIRPRPTLTRAQKIDFHNQFLDGITHLRSFGLSHGDVSLLNIQMTHSSDTIKLLGFGRSVSIDSIFVSLSDEPVDPFQNLA